MQITLFGGSFDPAQKAHRLVPQALLTQHLSDQVWFIPTQNHPFQKQISPAAHRVAMLELLIEHACRVNPELSPQQLQIQDFELRQSGTSYSYLTLQALRQMYPQHHFSWLMGSDLLASFEKWYHYQELLEQFPVIVYPRKGFINKPLLPGMTLLQNVPVMEISSTQVRERLANNQSITELVDPEIELYIRKNHLYHQTQ